MSDNTGIDRNAIRSITRFCAFALGNAPGSRGPVTVPLTDGAAADVAWLAPVKEEGDTRPMRTELDNDQLLLTVLNLFKAKEGEVIAQIIHVGHRLGLFTALDGEGQATSQRLAEATGYHERWVREWLFAMSAQGLIQHEDGTFALTPEARFTLVDEDSPRYSAGVFGPPITQHEIDRTVEAFTTGIGMTWVEHGPETCHFQAAMGSGGQRHYLVPVILDSIDGMSDRMTAGATVIDIGCGAGIAAEVVARAYPNSRVIGMDPSEHAIEAAAARAQAAGLSNLEFRTGAFDSLDRLKDEGIAVDLLLTLDVIHDLPRPGAAVRSARSCLADNGVWMVADIRAAGSLEENRNMPMLPLMYGMSILYCMSSAMSEPGGAGLGTMGLTPEVLREMTDAAGFSSFESREFDADMMNRYYELRP